MSTRAEQIIQAFVAALSEPTEVVPDGIWRSRSRPIPQSKSLAIVVRRGFDRRDQPTSIGRHFRLLNVTVEIYARGDEPDTLADPIIEQVMSRVMADRSLDGLCDDIETDSVDPEWAARDTDLVVMDLLFTVKYESLDESL